MNSEKKRTGKTAKFFRVLFSRKIVILALLVVVIFVLLAIFANVICRYDPAGTDATNLLGKPNGEHWLGTDQFGRDTLTRIIYGTRVSLIVGVLAVIIAAVIGVFLGLCAAYFGGWVDAVIMRCSEAIMSIPMIVVAIALIAILGHGILNLAVVLGLTSIPGYVRIMRGQALSTKESDYIKASELMGSNSFYTMLRHILPNAISPIIVMMTQQVGVTILMESGLSFIGVGVSVPIASWGAMVADGKNFMIVNPIPALAPGVAVALLVISLNVLGDGVRDALDPRLRGEL